MTGCPNDRLVGPGKFRLDSFKLTRRRQESKFRGLGAAGRLFMGLGPLNDLNRRPKTASPQRMVSGANLPLVSRTSLAHQDP